MSEEEAKMSYNSSVFENILNKEKPISTFVYNLLKFPEFKNIFMDFIGIEEELKPDNTDYIDNFYPERYLNKNCRPDLQIITDKIQYVIEMKVNYFTDLTKNQKKDYIKELNRIYRYQNKNNKKDYKLIYLLPKEYYKEKEFEKLIQKNNKNILSKSWDDFIRVLDGCDIKNQNLVIKEFLDFLKFWFWDEQDYKTLFEEKIVKLIDKLFGNQLLGLKISHPNKKNFEYYGKYIWIDCEKKKKIFVGFSQENYVKFEKKPDSTKNNPHLWVGVDIKDKLDEKFILKFDKMHEQSIKQLKKVYSNLDYIGYLIDMDPFDEKNFDKIVNTIKSVIEHLSN